MTMMRMRIISSRMRVKKHENDDKDTGDEGDDVGGVTMSVTMARTMTTMIKMMIVPVMKNP